MAYYHAEYNDWLNYLFINVEVVCNNVSGINYVMLKSTFTPSVAQYETSAVL